LDEVSLAYAISIHKSQGPEFPAVVIPLAMQHFMLLQRNLIYTGITRGKKLLVLVGQKKALGIAVRNDKTQRRYSGLLASLRVIESMELSGTRAKSERQQIAAPRVTSIASFSIGRIQPRNPTPQGEVRE
jgi:superfamily I DNA and RNA helicase